MAEKALGVMQPYIFPYLGYFQLVNAVDTFVFYDDVNFIKQGWINRNRLLINGQPKLVTFPCKGISSFKKIKDVEVNYQDKQFKKLLSSIFKAYKKAPFFKEVYPLVEKVMNEGYQDIGTLAGKSVEAVGAYLGLETQFFYSSVKFPDSVEKERAGRLIHITKQLGYSWYINMEGGKKLYSKSFFSEYAVQLNFLKPHLPTYQHFKDLAEPGLSIIDVLMFNPKDRVHKMLKDYELE